MVAPGYPPWVVLHIPHDSTEVPADVRSQFLLSDTELDIEIARMTDHFTHALFTACVGEATVVRAPVSRLVVDVERFADDRLEPMACRGMGAIYTVTSNLKPLRRALTPTEREGLMRQWYYPHHERLEAAVADVVARHGRCLVIDCHSFPSVALPYEQRDVAIVRPDICIGSDSFHTPALLERAFVNAFEGEGWRVSLNDPFAGALVPSSRYHKDERVMAVMVEVNRGLYLDLEPVRRSLDFDRVAKMIYECASHAIESFVCKP